MQPTIFIILPLILIVFWFWMFRDMTNNAYIPDRSTQPWTWPPTNKYDWTLAFIFLSIFAAIYYYFVEYRPRQM